MMGVDLDKIEVFFEVARSGSLTLASRHLGLAQPSVSRTIKILEKQMGVRLFIRSPHGMTPTPEGEELFSIVFKAFDPLQRAINDIRDMDAPRMRDYAPHLDEWRKIVELDYETALKYRGKEAARVLLNSAYEHTVLELEKIRDEIGGAK